MSLPYEVIKYIIEYSNDIDVRRSFGIYKKIKREKYDFINYIVREKAPNKNCFMHFNLKNREHIPGRRLKQIDNDMISMRVVAIQTEYANFLLVDFGIYRLKKKTGAKEKEEKTRYYKADLEDYYWDYCKYKYKMPLQ